MKYGPHIGNTKRNIKIFALYDTGEYSLKEIATQITLTGRHCTEKIVSHVIRERAIYQKFYAERFGGIAGIPGVES